MSEPTIHITPAGQSLLDLAGASGRPIPLTQAFLGAGAWNGAVPDKLVNQQAQTPLLRVTDGKLSVMRIKPNADIGGFTLTEIAIATDAGAVFAVVEYPALPLPADVSIDLTIDMGAEGRVKPIDQQQPAAMDDIVSVGGDTF